MVKKNTIIMSCEKYIKKLSYAYTGKLDEEIFCVSNNAYHHKVFILGEKNMHPRPSPIAATLYTLRDMNVDVIVMHGPTGCCFRFTAAQAA